MPKTMYAGDSAATLLRRNNVLTKEKKTRFRAVKLILPIVLVCLLGVSAHFAFEIDVSPALNKFLLITAPKPGKAEKKMAAPSEAPHSKNNIHNTVLPILMYQHIRETSETDVSEPGLSLSPLIFSKQLDGIQGAGFQAITFSDFSVLRQTGAKDKLIILAFENGYKDFYATVFPELKKRNLKAVIFIAVNDLGRTGYLSAGEIKEIVRSGLVEIGSHSLNHFSLKPLAEPELWAEIAGSKYELEKKFGLSVISFCYPFGESSPAARENVEKAGYEYAIMSGEGLADTKYNFTLYRIKVTQNTDLSKIILD